MILLRYFILARDYQNARRAQRQETVRGDKGGMALSNKHVLRESSNFRSLQVGQKGGGGGVKRKGKKNNFRFFAPFYTTGVT